MSKEKKLLKFYKKSKRIEKRSTGLFFFLRSFRKQQQIERIVPEGYYDHE